MCVTLQDESLSHLLWHTQSPATKLENVVAATITNTTLLVLLPLLLFLKNQTSIEASTHTIYSCYQN
jgi:hypothetical protein